MTYQISKRLLTLQKNVVRSVIRQAQRYPSGLVNFLFKPCYTMFKNWYLKILLSGWYTLWYTKRSKTIKNITSFEKKREGLKKVRYWS